jgi:glutamate 5-kinase
MTSKLDAAHKARRSGALVVIADARAPRILEHVLSGADVGTCFPPLGETLRARHHWIAYTLRPRGTVLVDAGAAEALSRGASSLLPIGVFGLRGDFRRGDSVVITTANGEEVARGLSRLSALEVARAAGKKGEELSAALGGSEDVVVIHKDDLVLMR